jgi:hypothetical protein
MYEPVITEVEYEVCRTAGRTIPNGTVRLVGYG